MTVCFEGFEECVENETCLSIHSSNPSNLSKQTVIITYKFMTFYLILKNEKNDKRQVGTQNKRKSILHLKNIIINKFMTYFYARKFCFINFPMILIYFFRPRPTSLTVYPYHMACDVNLVISIVRFF